MQLCEAEVGSLPFGVLVTEDTNWGVLGLEGLICWGLFTEPKTNKKIQTLKFKPRSKAKRERFHRYNLSVARQH